MFQVPQTFAQARDFIFSPQHIGRAGFNRESQFFDRGLSSANLSLQHVELVPRELRVQVLQFDRQLFVALRLSRLALERADLPLHFTNEIADAQEILIGIFEFAQRLAFLRFEFGYARGFLEDHPAVFRFAGQDLGDVPLRHDAVARASDARAHEKLLHVLQPARCPVDEIFAAAVAKNPPGNGHLVVGKFDSRRLQVLPVHVPNGQRHLGHAQRPATVRAVENHIRHFASPQRLGRLFAQHPPDRIGHVRFTASVRPDNRGNSRLEIQRGLVGKRLEAKHGQVFQIHILPRVTIKQFVK